MADTIVMSAARAAGFILSEAQGQRSRHNGVLTSGQVLKAGTVVELATGKLVAMTTGANSMGILLYDYDATGADKAVAYIARHCEVNLKAMIYPGAVEAAMITALAALGIICRN